MKWTSQHQVRQHMYVCMYVCMYDFNFAIVFNRCQTGYQLDNKVILIVFFIVPKAASIYVSLSFTAIMFKVSESFLLSSKCLVMRPSEFFVSLFQFCFQIVRSSEGSVSVCLVLCLGHQRSQVQW